jgi:uncharacterized Zn-binding protein involved in type VI secretion
MGKPAARITDTTAHGGTIVGPGTPTVLIGSMPAATLGDMHVCPMMTGPVPHVGGPITLGSTGVFLGKKPAARMGDMATCVGPPSSILLGCMTVLIGEAGSGSQAASAGSAAEASLAAMGDLSGIEPFPLMEPPPLPDQLHWARFRFVDSAGKPLPGIPYQWRPPGQEELPGMSDPEGWSRFSGYAQAGSFDVKVRDIADARWELPEAMVGDEIGMTAVADGFQDGEEAVISVLERTETGKQRFAARFVTRVSGGSIESRWKIDVEALGPLEPLPEKRRREEKTYHFCVYGGGAIAVSGKLRIKSDMEIEILNAMDLPVADREVELQEADGRLHTAVTDAAGVAAFSSLNADRAYVSSVG